MYQQQFKFFWPLTEQIPLDLDYSVCDKPKLTYDGLSVSTSVAFNGGTIVTGPSNVSFANHSSNFQVHVDEVEFVVKKNPNFLKRIIYRIMGIKWKTYD